MDRYKTCTVVLKYIYAKVIFILVDICGVFMGSFKLF